MKNIGKKKSYPKKMLETSAMMNISAITPNVYYNIARTIPSNAPSGILKPASGTFGLMGLSGLTKTSVDILNEVKKLNKKKL